MKKVLAFVLSAAMMLPALPMKAFSQNALPETAGEEVTKPETVNAEAEVSETTVENNMAADTAAVAKEDSVNEEETEVMAHAIPASGAEVSNAVITFIAGNRKYNPGKLDVTTLIRGIDLAEKLGDNYIPKIEFKVYLNDDNQETDIEKKEISPINEGMVNLETTFNKNTSGSDMVYRIEVYPIGKPEEKKTRLITIPSVEIQEYDSKVTQVNAEKTIYGYAGGNVTFVISGSDLDQNGLEYKITKDGQPYTPNLPLVFNNVVGQLGKALNVTFEIEPNEGEENVTYTFSVKGKKEADFKSASITQRGLKSYVLIEKISQQKFEIPEEGKKIRIELELNKEWDGELKTEVRKDGVKVDCLVEKISTDKKNSRIIYIHFPANTVKQVVNYTVHFMTDTEVFLDRPVVKLTQDPLSEKTVFTDIITKNAFLPLKGGVQGITIKGVNLLKEHLTIEAYKVVNNELSPVSETEMTINDFAGTDKLMTSHVKFEPVTEETTYKFVVKDTKYNNEKEIFIHLSKEGSDREMRNYDPVKLFFLTDTTIKMVINEPIKEARKDSIIKHARIIKDDVSYSLPEGTTVTVDGTDIYIDMKKWELGDYKNVKLHFPDRTIESLKKPYYQNLSFNHNVDLAGIIESSEFVEGSVLDHKGGKVHLQIKGHNFNDKIVRAKVSKLEALKKLLDGSVGVTELEDVEVQATDKQIDITFTAPPNRTDRIESYIVLLSLDGIYYSGEYAQTINERAKRMVVSVKNEGLDTTEPVLGFARITSYETNPIVNGVLDSLHTITPINQESKKTFVYLYGINLDEKKTKIRAIDSRGVIFSPVGYSVADSTDRFLTVAWAYQGYGNNQFIELIAPRMYKADIVNGEPVDQKYKYQIAVDGKNFNDEIVVHATVKDDGESRLDKSELFCEMKLNFVDEKGRVIHEPIVRKGYYILPPDAISMHPIEIEGYEYTFNHSEYDIIHKSIADFSPGLEKTKKGEMTYIYKNLNPEKEEPQKDVGENKGGNDYTEYNPEVVKENEGRSEDKTEINVEDPELPLGEVDAEAFDIPEVAPLPNVLIEDVKDSKYEKEITELAKYGIIKGTGENKVEPKKELSRAMFVEMLFRTVKDKTGDNKVLTDISSKDWFYESASWASAKGIVKGDAKGNFNGKKPLTAAEFAVMMDRFMKKFNIVLPKTAEPQKAEGPKWAIEALNNMYEMAVFGADIKATDLINREQAAGVLYKLLKAKNVIK